MSDKTLIEVLKQDPSKTTKDNLIQLAGADDTEFFIKLMTNKDIGVQQSAVDAATLHFERLGYA